MHEGTYYHNFITFKYLHCENLPSLELEIIFMSSDMNILYDTTDLISTRIIIGTNKDCLDAVAYLAFRVRGGGGGASEGAKGPSPNEPVPCSASASGALTNEGEHRHN